jgi:L-lactate dehydrogenase complex protein LldG
MNEKAFLENISARLGRPQPASAPARDVFGVPDFYRADPLLLHDVEAQRDLALRFQEEIALLGGQAFIEPSADAATARLQSLLQEWQPRKIVAWDPAEFPDWDLDAVWAHPDLLRPSALQQAGDFKRLAMQADLGITSADFAVANTGTLVLCASPTRPRVASLAASSHLALVRLSSLVPRLGEAFEQIAKRPGLPSSINCISGPSRTSDIENDSTIGVHGPAQVTVIFAP